MGHQPKCRMQNYKTPRSKVEENLGDLAYDYGFVIKHQGPNP